MAPKKAAIKKGMRTVARLVAKADKVRRETKETIELLIALKKELEDRDQLLTHRSYSIVD
jgi:hypothetical protein